MSVIQKLHDSEINCSLSTFYDGQFIAKLGDRLNGFKAEANLSSYEEACEWLDKVAKEFYPTSFYATGVHPEGYCP